MIQNKDSILGTIITLAEQLEGCNLDKDMFSKMRGQLNKVSDYLGTDKMAAAFFSIIFVIQNQYSKSVNLRGTKEQWDKIKIDEDTKYMMESKMTFLKS